MAGEDERATGNRGIDPAGVVSAAARAVAVKFKELDEEAKTPEGRARLSGTRLALDAIAYLDSESAPSFKVLLSYWLVVGKQKALPPFARTLALRTHPQWGTYLSYFFIVLQADGSRNVANIVAKSFADAGVLVLHGERAGSIGPGLAPGQEATAAGATAERFVYEGRTMVRLGGERFYVSGLPGEPYWLHRSTSVLFIYKASQPKKLYRLDYGKYVPKGETVPVVGWHHNVNRVGKILGLEGVDHTPAGGWGKAAGRACKVFRAAGRPLFFVTAGLDALSICEALDKGRAIARATGRLAGGAAGALGGAAGGTRVGRWWGPWGAGAGALLGGVAGAFGGAALGEAVADWGYCILFHTLDSEEWFLLDASQVVSPAPAAAPPATAAPAPAAP